MVSKKKGTKKPTGMVDVKVKTFRGTPAVHGNVFFTTGKLKHPGKLRIPAGEVNDLVEVIAGKVEPEPVEEPKPEPVKEPEDNFLD